MPKPSTKKTLLVGLTGGIGSGKSAAAKCFEELGAKVYSADDVAKEIVNSNKQVQKKIRGAFGDSVFLDNGALNRKEMSERVFNDENQLEKLNSIVHPAVIEKLGVMTAKDIDSGKFPIVIVEAALIYEAGIDENFDYIITVSAEEEETIKRLMKQRGMSKEQIFKRMKSQMPIKMKIDLADFVIQNNGTLETLKERCKFVFMLLKSM